MTRLFLLSLLPAALAHFHLLSPSPIGDDTAKQATAPCGGYSPSLADTTDVHVNGEPFVVQSSHPQSNWLIRATLDDDADDDWVQVYPIIQQSGLGSFCLPEVTFPSSFTGKKGFVSVVGGGDDGVLYSCVAANFVQGSGMASDSCKNSTGVSLSEQSDSRLSALLGSPDDNGNNDDNNDNNTSGDDDDSAAAGLASLPTAVVGVVALLAAGALGL